MSLYYLAHSRLPTNRAHGFQIMAMCESFAHITKTTLVLPSRKPLLTEDPFFYYHIDRNFTIQKLWSWDLYETSVSRKVAYWVDAITFGLSTIRFAHHTISKQEDVVFSRDVVSAFFLSLMRYQVIFEVHDLPSSLWYRWFFRKVKGVVVTNALKKEVLQVKWGIDPKKILVAHHGVKLEEFVSPQQKEEMRKIHHIPQDKKIIMYTGHLYESKGAPTLVEAARYLDETYHVYIVGGTPEDERTLKEKANQWGVAPTVTFLGNQPHPAVAQLLCAADILVIPSSGKFTHGAIESSPLKLFEYMAAQKPIVASDLPAIREAADGAPLYYVPSDNPEELAKKIKEIVPTSVEYKNLVSWQQRAQAIYSFAHDLCQPSNT